MKKIIERYKNLIWVWTLICISGVAVNMMGIKGLIKDGDIRERESTIYLFASDHHKSDDKIWPFVKFIENVDLFQTYATHNYDHTEFNGVFYGFDISEFFMYMGLLAVFLFYKAYIVTPKVKVTSI